MDLHFLDKPLPKVTNLQRIEKPRFFKLEGMDLEFSNGTRAYYERMAGSRGAVMAVPFDGSHFLLTVEYCGGVMQYQLGLVKGKIDEGETAEDAVKRELSEEIGFNAHKVSLLKHEMTVAPGMLELKLYAYLCEDLFPQVTQGDEPEPIDIVKVSIEEAKELIFNPNSPLTEGRVIAALTLALHKLGAL